MSKTVLPLEMLQELVQREIDEHEGFRGEVRALSPHWHETDADGCNWDVAFMAGNADLVASCRDAIAPAVRELRLRFDAPDRSEG